MARSQRKQQVETPPDPCGRQAARLPEQWDSIPAAELQHRHEQAACLRAKGHAYVDWDSLTGRR